MYCDTIDEIVIGLTPFTVYSLITTVNNTAEKRANLPSHIMKTTLLLQTPTPTQQDSSKMAVSVKKKLENLISLMGTSAAGGKKVDSKLLAVLF